jgi:hypothetical protein
MANAEATETPNGATEQKPAADPTAEQHANLTEALLGAQTEMPSVDRDQENPHFESKFTSLGHLLATVRPVLNRHGLVLVQAPMLDEKGEFVLRTTILHSSGDSMEFSSPLNPTKNDPQGQGSAITYMRRYVLAAALAIADQDDDDGARAAASQQRTEATVARLNPQRTERIIGSLATLKLSYKEIGMMLGSSGIDSLRANTAQAIQERISGLGEVEADALEAELAKAAQDADATAPDEPVLSDARVDQLMNGYEVAGAELGGVTPLDGLNLLLGELGADGFEPGADLREQFAKLPEAIADGLDAEFQKAVEGEDPEAEEVDGEIVGEGTDADA